MPELNIPVGVSDFREIRQNGYYYIDKSGLIRELLKNTATKVTLITAYHATKTVWKNPWYEYAGKFL